MKCKSLLSMCTCLLVACTHNVKDYSENSTQEIDVSECVDQWLWNPTKYECDGYVVKLETKEDVLLPRIDNVFFSENRIFVKVATPQIFIFDNEGNYINKLRLGNGPGEIAHIIDACFDAEKNELIVYQDPYICVYTPDGEYKYKKKVPYFFLKICSIKQGYLLKSTVGHMRYDKMPEATLIFVDKNFEMQKAYLNKQLNNPSNSDYISLKINRAQNKEIKRINLCSYDNNKEIGKVQGHSGFGTTARRECRDAQSQTRSNAIRHISMA